MHQGRKKDELGYAFHKTAFFYGRAPLPCLVATFALFVGVVPTAAADLVIAGDSVHSSVRACANADTIRSLDLLKKHAAQNTTILVIVGLRTAFSPEGGLTAAAAAQQRSEIARLQSVVLEKVPSLKQRPEAIKRFESSPFMALEVNAAELEALACLAEIASIEEDQLAAPTSRVELLKPLSK